MTEVERLQRIVALIARVADDPDRVRLLADEALAIALGLLDDEDAKATAAGKPSRAAIARCGRRAGE